LSGKIDLSQYLPDHYYCPLCNKMIAGLSSWASHTAQVHNLYFRDFEKKYGYKKYFYGVTLIEERTGEIDVWNPSAKKR